VVTRKECVFRAGFWHFALALLWAVALVRVSGPEFPLFPVITALLPSQPAFFVALITSSALFFVPDAWAKKG
jgi:hypothetical protein